MNGTCKVCGKELARKPKRTFLGFTNVGWVACFRRETRPLSKTYRAAYWCVAVLAALQMFLGLLRVVLIVGQGGQIETDLAFVGQSAFFGTLCGIALVRDKGLRELETPIGDPSGAQGTTTNDPTIDAPQFSWTRGCISLDRARDTSAHRRVGCG
jgi:hypothetical protein